MLTYIVRARSVQAHRLRRSRQPVCPCKVRGTPTSALAWAFAGFLTTACNGGGQSQITPGNSHRKRPRSLPRAAGRGAPRSASRALPTLFKYTTWGTVAIDRHLHDRHADARWREILGGLLQGAPPAHLSPSTRKARIASTRSPGNRFSRGVSRGPTPTWCASMRSLTPAVHEADPQGHRGRPVPRSLQQRRS